MACQVCGGEQPGRSCCVKLQVLLEHPRGLPPKPIAAQPQQSLVCVRCLEELERGPFRDPKPDGLPVRYVYKLVGVIDGPTVA